MKKKIKSKQSGREMYAEIWLAFGNGYSCLETQ